jgi:hypothetical protein
VGHFPLVRLDLPYAGRWRADVVVRRAEMRENRFSYEFVLSHLQALPRKGEQAVTI